MSVCNTGFPKSGCQLIFQHAASPLRRGVAGTWGQKRRVVSLFDGPSLTGTTSLQPVPRPAPRPSPPASLHRGLEPALNDRGLQGTGLPPRVPEPAGRLAPTAARAPLSGAGPRTSPALPPRFRSGPGARRQQGGGAGPPPGPGRARGAGGRPGQGSRWAAPGSARRLPLPPREAARARRAVHFALSRAGNKGGRLQRGGAGGGGALCRPGGRGGQVGAWPYM